MRKSKTILGFRIWPAPRWPLIHDAKRIYLEGGLEALQLWASTLTPGDRAALVDQLTDLLAAAVRRVENDIRKERGE